MATPGWLLELLNYKHTSAKLGPEDLLCIDFASRLRAWSLEGKLKATWTHIPHEIGGKGRLAMIRVGVAKMLGLIPGSGDYVFVGPTGGGWIEYKVKGAYQSPTQRLFGQWCDSLGVPYGVARSAAEGAQLLREWGLLADGGKDALA